jgi:hypothetical protein
MPKAISTTDSIKTLKSALRASTLSPWSGNAEETSATYRVELGEGPEIYEVIRQVLHTHAIEGAGLAGGSLEIYPLQDGLTFVVDWVDMDSTHAILKIVKMAKAY